MTFLWIILLIITGLFIFILSLYIKFSLYDGYKIKQQLAAMNEIQQTTYSQNSFKIINPYQGKGYYYKAQLHTHTSESDGRLTPRKLIEEYANKDYTFLAVTDHDHVTEVNNKKYKDRDIILITGEEMTYPRLFWPLGCHISRLFIKEHLDSGSLQTRLNKTAAQNGLSIINHPASPANLGSQQWFPETLKSLDNYILMEIVNPHTETEDNLHYWHALLKYFGPARPLWGIAGDDSHRPSQIDQNYIMVKTEAVTKKALYNSLINGSFYASQGPQVEFNVADSTIQVKMPSEIDESTTIKFIDADFIIKKEETGKMAEYTPSGEEGFIRIEVETAAGKKAWSQPFWLVENKHLC